MQMMRKEVQNYKRIHSFLPHCWISYFDLLLYFLDSHIAPLLSEAKDGGMFEVITTLDSEFSAGNINFGSNIDNVVSNIESIITDTLESQIDALCVAIVDASTNTIFTAAEAALATDLGDTLSVIADFGTIIDKFVASSEDSTSGPYAFFVDGSFSWTVHGDHSL